MKKLLFLVACVASATFSPGAVLAQSGQCYTVARAFAPNMMKCQQVGTTQMGTPIWQCCD